MATVSKRLIRSLPGYFKLSIAFLCIVIALRLYEYLIVNIAFVLPENAVALYLTGLFFDLSYFSFLVLIFGVVYFLIALIHEKAALWITGFLMGLFLIAYIGLIQYFGEVLTPLGADFFAYNFTELSDTVNTSVNFTVLRLLPFIIAPTALFLICYLLIRSEISKRTILYSFGAVLILNLVYFVAYPAQDHYEREIDFQITANKASIFFGQAFTVLSGMDEIPEFDGEEYPLLRTVSDKDPLGEYFKQADRFPNIVFIIVESLGAAVMPPHGRYQGFTPFLDSLSQKSLNWTNFLATSGRSFNVQPSLLGSLPYGERGFMDMGIHAPDHYSLITILNQNEYHTGYYCGYNSRFDKLDLFLERQEIDLLMDVSHFGEEYQKMDEIEGGFTWGYSDKDTYQRAFDYINEFPADQPRLDIFFTLNFHEPFIIPETEKYNRIFNDRLNEMEISNRLRNEFLRYKNIFSALLYTDDAIKELMERYRQRDDYENTIFIITGDHRMIPVPHASRIDRYHVPFMIYSPLLKEVKEFRGVSSHLDVTPSLVSFLKSNYNFETPEYVHWVGGEINTSAEFSSERIIPLMRNKYQIEDFLSGKHFLSGEQLFEISDGMYLTPSQDRNRKAEVKNEYQEFLSMNRYVTQENKIIPVTEEMLQHRQLIAEELQFLEDQNLSGFDHEELFLEARELAFSGDYDKARKILRYVLRQSPNYYDARLLYGRTYGWDGEYGKAEEQFRDVLNRNDRIIDAYSAIADIYFWQEEPEKTITNVNKGLQIEPDSEPLIFRKARAYNQKGEIEKARELVRQGLELHPDSEYLQNLRNQIS